MIQAYFDFVTENCKLTGAIVYSKDRTVSVVADCGTCPVNEIIPAYEKYDIDCVTHLNGVFSFCLYDSTKKQLLVARDRVGEKLMYYSQLPTGVMFSSELRYILPEISYPAINAKQLAEGIRYNYPMGLQQSWIEQIKRVRAGELIIVDKNGIRSKIYWKRDHTPSFTGTKQEAIAESLRLMRQSMKRCFESADAPVAVLLSGGIDSSSLAAFAKEIQQEVHVISAGYKGNNYTACDERDVARRFASEQGFVYHEVELDVNDFKQMLDEIVPWLDEPCFDVSCMAQMALYKKATEMGFKYIVSGLGGDEQFYSYKDDNKFVEAIWLRKQFLQLYPVKKHKKEYLKFIINNYKHILLPNHPALISEATPVPWTYNDYNKFANDAVLSYKGNELRFADIDVSFHYPENTDIISMYDHVFSTFASTLCIYLGNRLTNACGAKILLPLLDVDLIAFLDSLPLEMKYMPGKPKQFQKDIMAGIVPDYILYAKKRGFAPPFEFIREMCKQYKYQNITANHCFFNSMVADMMISNLLK